VRWKLLIAASLAAALFGAGACLLVVRFLLGAAPDVNSPGAAWAALLLPLVAVAAASVFVYRRTARRRTLQALATALLASLLTLTGLVAGSLILTRRSVNTPPSESLVD
jgi:uncharacterized membrane protein YfcA